MKHFLAYLISACLLSACYQPISETDENKDDKKKAGMTCELQVSVFGNIEGDIYPTYLLVFDDEGKCIKETTLTQSQPKVQITLNYGQYRLSALSGADYYSFPTTKNPEAKITYTEDFLPQKPLLMGQAVINLASQSASANLQMDHQTAEVSIEVTDLSPTAQKINFILDAPYHSINLKSDLDDPRTLTIPCNRKDQGWYSGTYYLLPTQGTHTNVSLEVLQGDSTLFLGYNLPFAIKNNYHYHISLSAIEGLKMDGVTVYPYVTTLSYKSDSIVLDQLPETPSLWDDHILVHIEKESATEGRMWLLSCNEWEDVPSFYNEDFPDAAIAIAESYEEGGNRNGRICIWSIPSREDANTLKNLYAAQNALLLNDLLSKVDLPTMSITDESGNNIRYLCNEAQHTFSLASASSSISKAGSKTTYRLRLIKKVHYRIKGNE